MRENKPETDRVLEVAGLATIWELRQILDLWRHMRSSHLRLLIVASIFGGVMCATPPSARACLQERTPDQAALQPATPSAPCVDAFIIAVSAGSARAKGEDRQAGRVRSGIEQISHDYAKPIEQLSIQSGDHVESEPAPSLQDDMTMCMPWEVPEAQQAPGSSVKFGLLRGMATIPGTAKNLDDGRSSASQPVPVIQPIGTSATRKEQNQNSNFQWRPALNQAYLFLGIQHAYRLATEPGTLTGVKGPFFRDYFASVRNLRGWRDGDEFFVNYVGHPLQGAVTGFIFINNDPAGRRQEVGRNKKYWMSRLWATAWSAAHSLQFEIGPISEASIGNVGLLPTDKSSHPMAYVDLVVTPVLGTGWVIGEDVLDRFVIRRVEDKTNNRLIRILFRSFLNPTRSFSNVLRGRYPWYRDATVLELHL